MLPCQNLQVFSICLIAGSVCWNLCINVKEFMSACSHHKFGTLGARYYYLAAWQKTVIHPISGVSSREKAHKAVTNNQNNNNFFFKLYTVTQYICVSQYHLGAFTHPCLFGMAVHDLTLILRIPPASGDNLSTCLICIPQVCMIIWMPPGNVHPCSPGVGDNL